ncbi:MAG TPA: hypothetical protein VFS43_31955 [Polyangiaceae bacterium]|nr:hypothetical protein [Polyangiaceae bacterium]
MRARRPSPLAPALVALASALLFSSGCYHYSFEHQAAAPSARQVVHKERRPTYLNGFVGTGTIDATRYCERPLRTELRVTAVDVALSVATLLIYTPHTLYVTCEVPGNVGRR